MYEAERNQLQAMLNLLHENQIHCRVCLSFVYAKMLQILQGALREHLLDSMDRENASEGRAILNLYEGTITPCPCCYEPFDIDEQGNRIDVD